MIKRGETVYCRWEQMVQCRLPENRRIKNICYQ